jgi:hypothetical protein
MRLGGRLEGLPDSETMDRLIFGLSAAINTHGGEINIKIL